MVTSITQQVWQALQREWNDFEDPDDHDDAGVIVTAFNWILIELQKSQPNMPVILDYSRKIYKLCEKRGAKNDYESYVKTLLDFAIGHNSSFRKWKQRRKALQAFAG